MAQAGIVISCRGTARSARLRIAKALEQPAAKGATGCHALDAADLYPT
jgi:hypothetical protein